MLPAIPRLAPLSSMRCTMLAIGARGDAQPLLTLGAGLRAAGLDVVCATHADFAEPARALGLETNVILGDSASFFGGAAGVAMRDRAADPRALRRFFDVATLLTNLGASNTRRLGRPSRALGRAWRARGGGRPDPAMVVLTSAPPERGQRA